MPNATDCVVSAEFPLEPVCWLPLPVLVAEPDEDPDELEDPDEFEEPEEPDEPEDPDEPGGAAEAKLLTLFQDAAAFAWVLLGLYAKKDTAPEDAS